MNQKQAVDTIISLVNNAPPMPDDYLKYSEKPPVDRFVDWRLNYAKKMGDEIAGFINDYEGDHS